MRPVYGARHHGCRVDEFRWRGHRLIMLENELLRIGVLASKGADLIEFRYKPIDLDLLWHAPQPVLPAGEGMPTTARAQGFFLDQFAGGWQEVLPNAGPATVFKGAELGQHGEVALLPWDVRVVDDSAAAVSVEFSVETMRTPFRLMRKMVLESGSPTLTFKETLTNLGEEDTHYAWGHHPALGPPFLEPGCRLELPECEVTQPVYAEGLKRRFATGRTGRFPFLPAVGGSDARVDEVQSKESRTEDVLLFSGYADGRCAVRNLRTGISFVLSWDAKIFPYFWCWQVYGGSYGYPYYGRVYTVAIEPFNCPILNLADAVRQNIAREMKAGATLGTELQVRIEDANRSR
jgi:galactose mutarotase-like enzyme